MGQRATLSWAGLLEPASRRGCGLERKKCSTLCSHAVTLRSTIKAVTGLTSEIERDPVLTRACGRTAETAGKAGVVEWQRMDHLRPLPFLLHENYFSTLAIQKLARVVGGGGQQRMVGHGSAWSGHAAPESAKAGAPRDVEVTTHSAIFHLSGPPPASFPWVL